MAYFISGLDEFLQPRKTAVPGVFIIIASHNDDPNSANSHADR